MLLSNFPIEGFALFVLLTEPITIVFEFLLLLLNRQVLVKNFLYFLMEGFAYIPHGLEIIEVLVIDNLNVDIVGGGLEFLEFAFIKFDAFLKVGSSLSN